MELKFKQMLDENFKKLGDYKERFKFEYYELKNRYNKLNAIVIKAKNGTLNFKLDCPLSTLNRQLQIMKDYLNLLEERAIYEDIELDKE